MKVEELQVIIDKTKADVVIVSEANMEIKDKDKITERESKFTEYNILDKIIGNNDKARVSMMISKKIKFRRVPEMEDTENPTIVVKIKEKLGKHLIIIGMYRQWKAPGEGGSNTAPGIARQVRRLKLAIETLKSNKIKDYDILLGGDINIDRHLPNNPLSRPELKALTPILEDLMTTC